MRQPKQINVFCEGPTEQGFCSQVLQPHLFPQSDGIIHTLAVGEKDHHHVYGLGRRTKYEKLRRFICNTIKHRQGSSVYFTTMFDLYSLPNDFPGKVANVRNPADPTPFVIALENAFKNDINYFRLIPYLQLHEFETMLFANPEAFRPSFENIEPAISSLIAVAASFASLEHIDDGMNTAPSKRIIDVIPGYEGRKASAGPDIAACIGLPIIRQKCPHFDQWLTQLEMLRWD